MGFGKVDLFKGGNKRHCPQCGAEYDGICKNCGYDDRTAAAAANGQFGNAQYQQAQQLPPGQGQQGQPGQPVYVQPVYITQEQQKQRRNMTCGEGCAVLIVFGLIIGMLRSCAVNSSKRNTESTTTTTVTAAAAKAKEADTVTKEDIKAAINSEWADLTEYKVDNFVYHIPTSYGEPTEEKGDGNVVNYTFTGTDAVIQIHCDGTLCDLSDSSVQEVITDFIKQNENITELESKSAKNGIDYTYSGKNSDMEFYGYIKVRNTDTQTLLIYTIGTSKTACSLVKKNFYDNVKFEKSEKTVTTAAPAETASAEDGRKAVENGDYSLVTPEFKATMDAYEAFIDDYIAFMKKYTSGEGNMLTMLTDYTTMLADMEEWTNKMDAIDESTLTPADDAYYLLVTLRIESKLAGTAFSALS